jgi:subtilase family serine protease
VPSSAPARPPTHPGVPSLAASGDNGFSYANYPTTWSKVIAVGGTTVNGTTVNRTTEGREPLAWAGSGSGCSIWVDKPRWQHDGNCPMRTASDVSAPADPRTGLAFYQTYGPSESGLGPGWSVGGGTNPSAPPAAGMIALSDRASSMDDASGLYEHSQELLDVVAGTNGGCGDDYLCTARPGCDAPTGAGTPCGPIGW